MRRELAKKVRIVHCGRYCIVYLGEKGLFILFFPNVCTSVRDVLVLVL